MPGKQNALSGEGKGARFLAGNDDGHTTGITRRQAMMRLGVPVHRVDLIARLVFGDMRS